LQTFSTVTGRNYISSLFFHNTPGNTGGRCEAPSSFSVDRHPPLLCTLTATNTRENGRWYAILNLATKLHNK